MSEIIKIDLPEEKYSTSIKFLRAEISQDGPPFALIRYSLEGKEEELGLRLDLEKRVFLDHFNDEKIQKDCEIGSKNIVKFLEDFFAKINGL